MIEELEKHIVVRKYWLKNTFAKYGNSLRAGRGEVNICAQNFCKRMKATGNLRCDGCRVRYSSQSCTLTFQRHLSGAAVHCVTAVLPRNKTSWMVFYLSCLSAEASSPSKSQTHSQSNFENTHCGAKLRLHPALDATSFCPPWLCVRVCACMCVWQ